MSPTLLSFTCDNLPFMYHFVELSPGARWPGMGETEGGEGNSNPAATLFMIPSPGKNNSFPSELS